MISPSVSTDVLAVLARAEVAFTPPEVHRLIGAHSEDGVRRALQELTRSGVVLATRSGQAVQYRLNRQHLAATHIVALANIREELLARLAKRIGAWMVPCAFSALFGSAARNEMRPDSDLDIFVVRPTTVRADDLVWRKQVDSLEEKASGWTGNDARTLEYGEHDVHAGLAAGDRPHRHSRRIDPSQRPDWVPAT